MIKAAAGFLGMATASTATRQLRPASAENTNTLAGEWVQPENVGGMSESLAFESEFAFNAIAPHWPGDLDFPAAVEISLSADGQTWSEPVVVGPAHTDAGPVDRDGRVFADLLFTDEASIVRYRSLDADGNVIAIPGLSFTYINAKAGPRISDIGANANTPTSGRPPIIGRGDWGAEQAYGGADRGDVEWTPAYQTVRHIIVHHSETPQFRDPLVEIRSIHYYHAVTRGWGDIGYNYLVDYLGNVYEGRAGGENVIGGHAYQYAQGSAGICTMGSFTMRTATPEAIAGLTWITAWAARNLDPLARNDFHETPNLPTICGHRDVVASACPGDGLYADLPTIRQAAADVISGSRQILTDPAFSPGQTIATTTEGGNLRKLPGTSQSVVTTLPYGAVMHIADGPTTTEGYTWYQVTGSRGAGWMASSLLTASNAEPPSGQFTLNDRLQVNTDYLNIRQDPSIRSPANATIPYATVANVIDGPTPAGGYRWYRLDTGYGRGWAVEQYLGREGALKPQTRFIVGDTIAVSDSEGVRLRSGPALGSSIVARLNTGTRATVTGDARVGDGETWIEIATAQGAGWSVEKYFTPSNSGPATPSRFSRCDAVRVSTDALNLREAPGTNRPVIRTLGNGITGTVTEPPSAASNLYWVRIDTAYGIGWVAEAFLEPASDDSRNGSFRTFATGDRVYIDTDGINIRTAPGTGSARVAILYSNETGSILDGPRESGGYIWYKIESAKGTGWGVSRYLGFGSADPGTSNAFIAGDTVRVDTDGINLRSRAGLSGSRVTVIYTDTEGVVLDGPVDADGYSWVKLQTGQGTGWGVATYLARVTPSYALGSTAKVFDGELNLREAASTRASVVGVLPDGAAVEIIDGPESNDGYDWVRVTSSRYGTGWCVTRYLARN